MVGWALPADADVFVQTQASRNGKVQHHFHCCVAFVKRAGNRPTAVAVHAQSELGHIVGTDGEAVKVFQELLGKQRVAGHFAHHNQAQAVFTAFQAVFFEHFQHRFRFGKRAHKGNHHFHIGQPHHIAHIFHRAAFQRKARFEVVRHITRRTTEAQHGVFFVWLILRAAEQACVFVGFEIRHPHDDFFRISRCRQRGDAFGKFVHIKINGRCVACDAVGDFGLQFRRLFIKLQQRVGVDANLAVNHKLHPRQADAFAGQVGKRERHFGVAHVHHNFGGRFGHMVKRNFVHFHFQQA